MADPTPLTDAERDLLVDAAYMGVTTNGYVTGRAEPHLIAAVERIVAAVRADAHRCAADDIESLWPDEWREWNASEDSRAPVVRASVRHLRDGARALARPADTEADR